MSLVFAPLVEEPEFAIRDSVSNLSSRIPNPESRLFSRPCESARHQKYPSFFFFSIDPLES